MCCYQGLVNTNCDPVNMGALARFNGTLKKYISSKRNTFCIQWKKEEYYTVSIFTHLIKKYLSYWISTLCTVYTIFISHSTWFKQYWKAMWTLGKEQEGWCTVTDTHNWGVCRIVCLQEKNNESSMQKRNYSQIKGRISKFVHNSFSLWVQIAKEVCEKTHRPTLIWLPCRTMSIDHG